MLGERAYGDPESAPAQAAARVEPAEAATRLDVLFLPPAVRPVDPAILEWAAVEPALEALRSGRPRDAAILLEDLRRRHESSDLLRLHGYALVESGETAAAERLAWAGMESRELEKSQAAYLLARSLHRRERERDSLPWFRTAVEATPRDAVLLREAAEAAVAVGQGELALNSLDRLMLLGELPTELLRLRARALALAGKPGAARTLFDRLLAAAPEDPTLWDEAGLAVFQAALNEVEGFSFQDAADRLEKAAALDPQNARIQYNLACAMDWGEDATGAENAYLRAVELDPGYLQASENLAELLLRNGRLGEAQAVLVRLLRQPLSVLEASRVQSRLDGLGRSAEPAPRSRPR